VPVPLIALLMMFVYDYLRADLYTLDFVRVDLPVSSYEIGLNHLRLLAVSIAAIVLGGVEAVLWLLWQYRAHANLASLALGKLRFRPLLAVGTWFVPVANLVLPLVAMRELWRASDPFPEGLYRRKRWTNPLLWIWWAGFLAGLAFVARGLLLGLGATTADDLIGRDHAFQYAALIAIPTVIVSAILIALIDRRLALAEDRARFPSWEAWTAP
jgi:hypothetical protein